MKKLILLLALSFSVLSCTDDEPTSYDNSPYIVGFFKSSDVQSYVATGDIESLNIPINLIGGEQGLTMTGDVNMTYELDPSSTAVEGDEFDFVNPTNTVVLQAGTNSVNLGLKINTGNLETGAENAKKIVLNIKTASSLQPVVVGAQYRQITITLNGLCFSNLQGMYTLTTTRLDNNQVFNLPGEEIIVTGPGTYLTTSTGPYNTRGLIAAGAQVPSPTPGFNFLEVCGAITLQPQNLCNIYSNMVTQSSAQAANSFKNSVTGVITIEYTISGFTAGPRNYRGVYVPN